MKYSRRSFAFLLPAIAAAQENRDSETLPSKAYRFRELPVKVNEKTKSVGHAVFDGKTHAGFRVEVHETELTPGASPHPPHQHVHEEMFMIQSGIVDITVNGKTTRIGPGSVVFIHSMDKHGIRNPGPNRARYFVTALGTDA